MTKTGIERALLRKNAWILTFLGVFARIANHFSAGVPLRTHSDVGEKIAELLVAFVIALSREVRCAKNKPSFGCVSAIAKHS